MSTKKNRVAQARRRKKIEQLARSKERAKKHKLINANERRKIDRAERVLDIEEQLLRPTEELEPKKDLSGNSGPTVFE